MNIVDMIPEHAQSEVDLTCKLTPCHNNINSKINISLKNLIQDDYDSDK